MHDRIYPVVARCRNTCRSGGVESCAVKRGQRCAGKGEWGAFATVRSGFEVLQELESLEREMPASLSRTQIGSTEMGCICQR